MSDPNYTNLWLRASKAVSDRLLKEPEKLHEAVEAGAKVLETYFDSKLSPLDTCRLLYSLIKVTGLSIEQVIGQTNIPKEHIVQHLLLYQSLLSCNSNEIDRWGYVIRHPSNQSLFWSDVTQDWGLRGLASIYYKTKPPTRNLCLGEIVHLGMSS